MVTFVAAIAIAFWRGWQLTLVMIALLPLIAIAGGILAKVLTWGTTRRAEAYEKANTVASQSIANIRTVASFQAEEPVFKRFADMLDYPRKISAKLSLYNGMAGGSINAAVFLAYVTPNPVMYCGACQVDQGTLLFPIRAKRMPRVEYSHLFCISVHVRHGTPLECLRHTERFVFG